MTKIYLSKDGVPRFRQDGEHNHLDMAKTILGAAWTPGDTAEAIEANYRTMWDAGWVRVIDTPTTLYGEKWLDGESVPFANLPRVQREWLAEHSALVGKQLYWNAKVFESTREGESNAAHAVQVLTAGRALIEMQRIYLSEDGVARMLTGDTMDDFDHADVWEEVLAPAMAEKWHPEVSQRFTTVEQLRDELLPLAYAFPRGRVVSLGRTFAVYHGDNLAAFMGSDRKAIETGFDIQGNVQWEFDEHEQCVAHDRDRVRELLGLEETWPAVAANLD